MFFAFFQTEDAAAEFPAPLVHNAERYTEFLLRLVRRYIIQKYIFA